MYAIVVIAGQQFKVTKDQKLYVHRLNEERGANVEFTFSFSQAVIKLSAKRQYKACIIVDIFFFIIGPFKYYNIIICIVLFCY